jgi:hypothetical protein
MGSPTTLVKFAQQHRLRVTHDGCRDTVVRGKFGHVYEHSASRFGIVLEASANGRRFDNSLRSRKRRAIASGFILHQEGDFESILLFDPTDERHAELSTWLIKAKKIKIAPQPSNAQLRVRALFSSKARSKRPCFDQDTGGITRQEVQIVRAKS